MTHPLTHILQTRKLNLEYNTVEYLWKSINTVYNFKLEEKMDSPENGGNRVLTNQRLEQLGAQPQELVDYSPNDVQALP